MNKKLIIIVVAAILIIAATVSAVSISYSSYHPESISAGENKYKIDDCNIEKNGIEFISQIIKKSFNSEYKYNVAYFTATINADCEVKSFTLSLDIYDASSNYIGLASYSYSNKKLTYTKPDNTVSGVVHKYNNNSSITYLDTQLKHIPLSDEIKVCGLSNYVIAYQPSTIIPEGTPIFDGRNGEDFKVLTKDKYNAGAGGMSDGKTNVVIRLYDGTSIAAGQQYLYVCKPLDADTAVGNSQFTMECDYYINNNTIKFTRNYGQDWITADISAKDMSDTLSYYNSLSLPSNSIFISSDERLPVAFFYGSEPKLRISNNNGKTWRSVDFPTSTDYGRDINKRVIGFVDKNFGYAALGTDWSMGTGECKKCYFTSDGGKTWSEKELPCPISSNTLNDLYMTNKKEGIIALSSGMDEYFPTLYVTSDTGNTWSKINVPTDSLPEDIQYLTDIDSLTINNGKYTLTLGQGNSGTIKAKFTSPSLNGEWKYDSFNNDTIHTVG